MAAVQTRSVDLRACASLLQRHHDQVSDYKAEVAGYLSACASIKNAIEQLSAANATDSVMTNTINYLKSQHSNAANSFRHHAPIYSKLASQVAKSYKAVEHHNPMLHEALVLRNAACGNSELDPGSIDFSVCSDVAQVLPRKHVLAIQDILDAQHHESKVQTLIESWVDHAPDLDELSSKQVAALKAEFDGARRHAKRVTEGAIVRANNIDRHLESVATFVGRSLLATNRSATQSASDASTVNQPGNAAAPTDGAASSEPSSVPSAASDAESESAAQNLCEELRSLFDEDAAKASTI